MAGIVVITYNSEDVIEDCLRACFALPGKHTVLVVDNASSDRTVARARSRGATVEANARNRGFAGAANQGISALDDSALLILNPDAVPVSGIAAMEEAVVSGRTGAVGGQLVGAGPLQARSLPSAWTLAFEVLGINRVFPWNPVNRRYRHPDLSGGAVGQPPGAFLMIRRDAWVDVGGFDEQFHPIWFEDVDYCKRLLDKGWKVGWLPQAVAMHAGGHSVKRLDWGTRQLFWYSSLLRYGQKHFATTPRLLVAASVIVACFPRTLVRVFLTGSREPWSVYIKLVRQAGRSLRVQPVAVSRTVETQTKT